MTAKKTAAPKARKPRAPRKPKPEVVTTTEMVEVAKISNPIAVARHMLSNAMAKRFDSMKSADLNWEAEKLFALQIIERDPKGEKAAALMNNPGAIVTCLMEVAAMGLTLSPTAGLVYLIAESPGSLNGVKMPQQLTVKVSYKGMEQSVLAGGQVIDIMTERVFTNDAFEVGRNQNGPTFDFKMARGDRGVLEGAFCFARYANGGSHLEWMTALEIEAVKKQALTKGGIVWKGDWEPEMQKKAVVRRAHKHWPRTPRAEATMANFDKGFSFEQKAAPTEAMAVELMTVEHVDELDALLREIAPNLRAVWIQRMAEALGYANVEDAPDALFPEFKTRLEARLKVVLDRANSGVKQLHDTNEGS